MKNLQITGRFNIHEGKTEEFKKIVSQCINITKSKDKNTLQYDWFFNHNETKCAVREIFKDSEAAVEHLDNLDALIDELLEVSDYTLEIYGNPSQELLNAAAGFLPKVYSYFDGL